MAWQRDYTVTGILLFIIRHNGGVLWSITSLPYHVYFSTFFTATQEAAAIQEQCISTSGDSLHAAFPNHPRSEFGSLAFAEKIPLTFSGQCCFFD